MLKFINSALDKVQRGSFQVAMAPDQLGANYSEVTPEAHSSSGSSNWASIITASGVGLPRSLSKATLNCAAKMLRRT